MWANVDSSPRVDISVVRYMGKKCERYKCQDKRTTRQDSVYKTGVKSQGQSEEKESEMSQGPCVDENKTRQDKTRKETRSKVKRPLA